MTFVSSAIKLCIITPAFDQVLRRFYILANETVGAFWFIASRS
jgi:hypothetical protein